MGANCPPQLPGQPSKPWKAKLLQRVVSERAQSKFCYVKNIKIGVQCPVCLKEYSIGDVAKKLPCKHAYHPECILPWLQKVFF